MSIQEFFNTYYVEPLVNPHTSVYNIYNTITYGIILAAMVFLIYKLLKKMNVQIDKNFFIATLPYILIASVLRVLEDAFVYSSPWLVSPLLYILVFGITISALAGSLLISKYYKKLPYHFTMALIGLILLGYFSSGLRVLNLTAVAQIVGVAALASGLIYLFGKFSKMELFSNLNVGIISASMFDASSTAIGMAFFGYAEKHVLPSLLIGYSNPWIMFPLKLVVILLALYVIDDSEIDLFFKNFLKFAILCITLGPGARNTLRLMMGV